jgi:hypothetical protein
MEYPPRASAIIAAAFVEDALRVAIYISLSQISEEEERALFEAEGAPLSSFHGKILIGHAIGVYGPVAKTDLLTGNAFAHAPRSIDFDTPEIIAECNKLCYRGADREMTEHKTNVPGSTVMTKPREIFNTTVSLLFGDLTELSGPSSGMP